MNKQQGSSVIGIIAVIAVALMAGIFIGAKTDIANFENAEIISEINNGKKMIMEKMDNRDDMMMKDEDGMMMKEEDSMMEKEDSMMDANENESMEKEDSQE